jgi:hypothetical protein
MNADAHGFSNQKSSSSSFSFSSSKILADNAAEGGRLKARMRFTTEPCIGHQILRLMPPTILGLTLFGCVGNRQSDNSDETYTPRPKQGVIIAVQDIPSPDGRYVCTLFGETFCDTTGYRRHIYLHRAGEPRGFPGNVHIVEAGDDVEVSWTSPTNLSVRLSFESPKFRQSLPATTNVAGVTVSFLKLTK